MFQTHFIHLRPLVAATPAFIGYVNIGGQLTTHTRSYSVSGESQVMPTTAQIANQNILIGSIAGTEIIATGPFNSTANLIIAGPTRRIHTGATAAEHQNGGGTVTIVDPFRIGLNGFTNILVDANVTTKWGTDWTKLHGWFFDGAYNAQLQNSGTIEIRSADLTDVTSNQVGGNTVAGSIVRYIGKPVDGTFYDSGEATHSNTGTIELLDKFLLVRRGILGTGSVRITDGSALMTNKAEGYGFQSFQATQTYQVAGEGFVRAGVPKGAVVVRGNARIDGVAMTLTQDTRVSGHVLRTDINNGFNLPFISTADKVLSVGSPAVGAEFGDAALAFVKFNAASPSHLGGTKVDFGTLQLNVGGAINNSQYLELTGNGKADVAISNFVKSLRSTSQTTSVSITTGQSLFLNNQESTPVAANLTGPGNVVLTQSGGAKGTYMFDRDAVSMTGTFNVTSPNDFGTVRALTTLAGPLTIGSGSAMIVSNVGGIPSRINATTWTLNAGWKVNVPAGLTPGTYIIGTKTAGGAVSPLLGTNYSGLTPTFAWVGNNLTMTLAPI